jgi:hypothetical protein
LGNKFLPLVLLSNNDPDLAFLAFALDFNCISHAGPTPGYVFSSNFKGHGKKHTVPRNIFQNNFSKSLPTYLKRDLITMKDIALD